MRMLMDFQMPLEPINLHFDASVTFHPCMTPEDLGKANLLEIGKKYR